MTRLVALLFEPQSYMTAQAGNTITPNSPARWDNALSYTTPNWGGFTGKAIYSFGENSSCTVRWGHASALSTTAAFPRPTIAATPWAQTSRPVPSTSMLSTRFART
jgi:predicted porin